MTDKEDRILAAIFACNSAGCPRPFALYRTTDVTGVSGTGTVAHGVQFADGEVVIRWTGEHPSTVIWESLDAAMKIHGHDGRTRVVWVATDFSEMARAEDDERERIAQFTERLGEEFGDAPAIARLIRECHGAPPPELDTRASRAFPAPPADQGYVIECEDCQHREFWLVRRNGCIRFKCVQCGSEYIDDEGFGRP